MLDPRPLRARLFDRLREAVKDGATAADLLSISVAAPELSLRGLPAVAAPYFYWSRPAEERYLLGLGDAWSMTARGGKRFETLSAAPRNWHHRWAWLDLDDTGVEPVAFAGFAYDSEDPMEGSWEGFPNSMLRIPALQLQRHGNESVLVYTCPAARSGSDDVWQAWGRLTDQLVESLGATAEPSGRPTPLARESAHPDPAAWREAVQNATRAIRTGRLTKVVPARSIRVRGERRLDTSRLMAGFAYMYPSCALIAVSLGGRALASATPERLVALEGGELVSDAVGGTIRRAPGEAEDAALGEQLLHHPRMRHEHAVVVDHIRETLAPLCGEFSVPPRPGLLKLRNLQHLWTRMQGTPAEDMPLLELARRLHPTPAVGGLPREAAAAWFRDTRQPPRGWYTGAAGWIGRSGEGELSVLLRCALLDGHCADLYAGAGVVSDSDPDEELAETELKFGAVLEALENA